jgi:type VI protein secretion system component Hcp
MRGAAALQTVYGRQRMLRRQHAPDRQRPEEPERRPAVTPRPDDAARLLALQRSAGNRAVNTLLARAPDDKKPQEEQGAARVTLPGIGTISVLSFGFANAGRPGLGTVGGSADKGASVHDMTFSSRVGEHSPKLQRAVIDGKPMTVEVVMQSSGKVMRLTLTGALVSNYSTSSTGPDAIESWTLNFQAMEHKVEGAAAEGAATE